MTTCYFRRSFGLVRSLLPQVFETTSKVDDIDNQTLVARYADDWRPQSHGRVLRAAGVTQTD